MAIITATTILLIIVYDVQRNNKMEVLLLLHYQHCREKYFFKKIQLYSKFY